MSRARRSPLVQATLTLIFALLFLHRVMGVSFLSPPSINGGATTYTTDDLVCSWNGKDVTAINVSWYNGSTLYSSSATLTNSSTLPAYTARKGETWYCNVTLFNATDNTSKSASVNISNSKPSVIGVFNGSQDVGYAIQMSEGGTLILTMNASDADNDPLTFLPPQAIGHDFCSLTGSDAESATYSCSPVHADVQNGSLDSEIETYVNYTFVVTDKDVNGRSIIFDITPVNDAPTLSIPTQQTNVTAVFNETFNATDEERDYPLTATLDANATDAAIRDDVTVSVEGNRTVRVTYFTSPTQYSDWGNRTITFNLTDARGASSTISFVLEILKENQPPFFTNISPSSRNSSTNRTYVLFQGGSVVINLSANDPDTADRNETLLFSDNSTRTTTTTRNATATNTSDAHGQLTFSPGPLDVGNFTIAVIVNDTSGDEARQNLTFIVQNVNDAPIIYNESYDEQNSGNNTNIYNLTAYLNAPFFYQINYTDYDLDWGDALSWSDNSSSFNVTQGVISFTPTGLPRNETVNITVTDSQGASATVLTTIEIVNNTPPYFNDTFPELLCGEGVPCILNVSSYAKDDDAGDSIKSYDAVNLSTPLSSFALDPYGLINFTPNQSEIGTYQYNITITDTRGATAWQTLNITIVNTEDYPRWDATVDFSNETIVEHHEFTHTLIAYDKDLLLPNSTEQLFFATNLSWVSLSSPSSPNGDTVTTILSFTPNSSQVGDHTIQLNVTDATGRTNTTSFTFTVIPDSAPPQLAFVKPYGDDANNNTLVDGWLDVASLSSDLLTVSENQTVSFEANATDDQTSQANLYWWWYYDTLLVQSGSGTSYKSYSKHFAFNESGEHNLTVIVRDETLNTDTFTWHLGVENVNRPPEFMGNLTANLSINSITTYQDYFIMLSLSNPKGFYDPDDDTNNNGLIDENETQNLTYSATECSHVTFSYSGNDLIVTPVSVGTCYVTFNATDPYGETAESNLIQITVTEVPQGNAQSTSSSSSGGSSSTSNTFIPLETEVETPKPLTIISPQLVTIYKNRTVRVPIHLQNNWTEPLQGIQLHAKTNASGVKLSLDTDYIEELPVDGTSDLFLTVTGYRLGENFEVTVSANVSDPSFSDKALILFNSIEKSEDGEEVQVKVTFAKDLLSQHSECQELNELLLKANGYLKQGQFSQANDLLDLVINGCQYLLSKTQEEQRPGVVRTPWIELDKHTVSFLSFLLLGIFLIGGSLGLLYYHYKTKGEYDF